MFPPEMTSERVSENVVPIARTLLKPMQMFKQNIQDDAIRNANYCGYLQDFQSSIARYQLFDIMATIISSRFDWPSS